MGIVAIVGSTNIDLAMRLPKWPDVGETITGTDFQTTIGGKGANQAVAASRLGAKAAFISSVGQDSFGSMARNVLAEEKIQLELFNSEKDTGIALIDIGPDGGNIIKLAAGANADLGKEFVQRRSESLSTCDVLLLQNEVSIETSLEAARLVKSSGGFVVMDPAPAPVPMWSDDVFSAFDLITPNASEAGELLGSKIETLQQGIDASRALSDRLATNVIVTLGEFGASWTFDGVSGHRTCPEVEAIDTVAAGDCFNGAFAACFSKQKDFERAVTFALHAAAIATTRQGAIESLPNLVDVQQCFGDIASS